MQHSDAGRQLLRDPDRGIIALHDAGGIEQLPEGIGDQMAPLIHRRGEGLDNQQISVTVHDHPRQSIGLAPGKAVDRLRKVHGFPHGERPFQSAEEKVGIQILFAPGKSTRHDLGVGIVNRGAKRPVAVILQRHHITRDGFAGHLLNLRAVDPVMSVKDASAGLDDESGHSEKTTLYTESRQVGRIPAPDKRD